MTAGPLATTVDATSSDSIAPIARADPRPTTRLREPIISFSLAASTDPSSRIAGKASQSLGKGL
jgi:hypothetical protein